MKLGRSAFQLQVVVGIADAAGFMAQEGTLARHRVKRTEMKAHSGLRCFNRNVGPPKCGK